MGFLGGGQAILVFARPSGREAGEQAVRDVRARHGVDHLRAATLMRRKLLESVGAKG
jgi:hypothetical protein